MRFGALTIERSFEKRCDKRIQDCGSLASQLDRFIELILLIRVTPPLDIPLPQLDSAYGTSWQNRVSREYVLGRGEGMFDQEQ